MTEPKPETTSGELTAAIANLVARHGRDAVVEMREQARAWARTHCVQCDEPMDLPPASRRRTCSDACRQARRRDDLEAQADRDAYRDAAADRDEPRP